jgi:hypothetical protein
VIETCARFLFDQKERLDIERHDRDIKNSSFMCYAENLVTLCLFFTIKGETIGKE